MTNAIPFSPGLKDGQKKQGMTPTSKENIEGSTEGVQGGWVGVRLDAERQSGDAERERDVSRWHFDDDEAAAGKMAPPSLESN